MNGPILHVQDIVTFLGERILTSAIGSDTVIGAAALTPGAEHHLSFASGTGAAAVDSVNSSASSVILVHQDVFHMLRPPPNVSLLAVSDPRLEFARAYTHFFDSVVKCGIHPSAIVETEANIHPTAYVGPGAHIAHDVVIGSEVWIGPNVVILTGTSIGSDCRVGPGSVIGNSGFGYAREPGGTPVAIPHIGGVVIGDRVEIGANTCIDRGTLDNTVIENDAKIDNLVHIAHNCRIGAGAFVIASAMIAGSVQVGPRAWIAPNSSIREKRSVGADAIVGLAAVVTKDVHDGETVVGNPARIIGPG